MPITEADLPLEAKRDRPSEVIIVVLLAEARMRLPPTRKDDCILVQNQQENDKVPGRPSNADIVRPTMLSYGGVEGAVALAIVGRFLACCYE